MTSDQTKPILVQPNQFLLGGFDIEINYETTSIAGVPQLIYKDRSQTQNFRGEQIRIEQTQLGQMVTVTLKRDLPETGADETLTLLVPAITLLSTTKTASTRTIAIFSLRRDASSQESPVLKIPGQSQNYMTLCLAGTANQIDF
jgi:ribosomal protein L19